MKKLALLLIVAATLACCKKEKDNALDGLVSRWELRKMVGGIWGTLNYQPGDGPILEFKSNDSFTVYEKGTLVQSGMYGVDRSKLTFHYPRYDDTWNATITADSLELGKAPECCDMVNYHKYVRVN